MQWRSGFHGPGEQPHQSDEDCNGECLFRKDGATCKGDGGGGWNSGARAGHGQFAQVGRERGTGAFRLAPVKQGPDGIGGRDNFFPAQVRADPFNTFREPIPNGGLGNTQGVGNRGVGLAFEVMPNEAFAVLDR